MRAILLIALLMGISVITVVDSTAQASPPPAGATSQAVLRVGDVVRVSVWRNPELGGTVVIGDDGTMIHPIYRSVRAAGLTHRQLEDEVRQVLQRFEVNPEFVVEPLYQVWVTGEVRSPNMYAVPQFTSVPQAVAQAGGPTPDARLRSVRLLRDGRETTIDLTRPSIELAEVRVHSGDQIIVERRTNLFRDRISPAMTVLGSFASLAWVMFRIYNSVN
jgi:polysaccharide biosynthesis/export protein